MNPANSLYSNEVYTIRGDMCYDNKIMLNTTTSPHRQHQQHVVNNIPEPTDDVKCKKRLRSKIRTSILLNAIIGVMVTALMLYLEFGLPYRGPQGFYCKDPSLSFPYRGDTITIAALLVVATVVPLLLFVTIETIREEPFWRIRARVVWLWYKQYIIFMYVNLLLVEAAKVAVGEHRPHFLTTCVPDTGKLCEPGSYVQEYTCTNKEFSRYFQSDTSRSFPSGHASTAAFLAIFCVAYLQQRFPTRRLGEVLKYALITLFLLWGCLCSFSRITDRRHHWWDVLVGMVLGVACAVYGLFMVSKEKMRVKRPPRTSPSTTTLLDEKNKDATSIAI